MVQIKHYCEQNKDFFFIAPSFLTINRMLGALTLKLAFKFEFKKIYRIINKIINI